MNKLTLVLTGKKQSGKSTMCNYIRARYLSLKHPNKHFGIDQAGNLVGFSGVTEFCKTRFSMVADELQSYIDRESVKVYSFADPLKDFCINVLGVPYEGCWGTDAQKNTPVPHLLWENLAQEYRPYVERYTEEKYVEFSGVQRAASKVREHRTGPMTGREVMQIFGTDICRRLYGDCWARGTYNKIKSEGIELALVADARFPNEITIGTEVKAKTVRLGRNVSNDNHASEIALDNFPREQYTLFIDNSNHTIKEQCAFIDPYIDQWFAEAGII